MRFVFEYSLDWGGKIFFVLQCWFEILPLFWSNILKTFSEPKTRMSIFSVFSAKCLRVYLPETFKIQIALRYRFIWIFLFFCHKLLRLPIQFQIILLLTINDWVQKVITIFFGFANKWTCPLAYRILIEKPFSVSFEPMTSWITQRSNRISLNIINVKNADEDDEPKRVPFETVQSLFSASPQLIHLWVLVLYFVIISSFKSNAIKVIHNTNVGRR